MSIQRPKSEPIPAIFAHTHSRRSDPGTSREAARNHAGKASTHIMLIYRAVKRHPDRTAVELSQVIDHPGIDRYEVSRRLADLKMAGRVRVSGRRRCGVKGTNQSVWIVSE